MTEKNLQEFLEKKPAMKEVLAELTEKYGTNNLGEIMLEANAEELAKMKPLVEAVLSEANKFVMKLFGMN
jgi:PHP family Zn ribbon phosphoesterase